jgi:hypothetical protein
MSWGFLDDPVLGLYTLTGSELLMIIAFLAVLFTLIFFARKWGAENILDR